MKFTPLAPKKLSIGLAGCLTVLSLAAPAKAENVEHTRQLLSTKQCSQCDLSNAGLVFAKLSNANLIQANLSGANLSRANLQGADLRGANLTGASLYGANLMGAKLDGAILNMTDLRNAYVAGVTHKGAVMENALLQGAIGLPTTAGSAGDFYRWGLEDAKQGNHPRAVENFTQALLRQPDLAPAYLGRAVSRLHALDRQGAIADTQRAEQLFKTQGDTQGVTIAQALVKELTAPPPKQQKDGNGLGFALLNIAGMVLRVLAFF